MTGATSARHRHRRRRRPTFRRHEESRGLRRTVIARLCVCVCRCRRLRSPPPPSPSPPPPPPPSVHHYRCRAAAAAAVVCVRSVRVYRNCRAAGRPVSTRGSQFWTSTRSVTLSVRCSQALHTHSCLNSCLPSRHGGYETSSIFFLFFQKFFKDCPSVLLLVRASFQTHVFGTDYEQQPR